MEFFSLGFIKIEPLNVDQFESLQKTLSKHLYELMDQGKTVLGPFELKIVAMRQPAKISDSEERVIFTCMNWHTDHDKFYIHEFAKLLEKYGSLLSKCPHCGRIFIQLRKNAMYCDRKCQRVAVMRKIRAKQIKTVRDDSKNRKKAGGVKRARPGDLMLPDQNWRIAGKQDLFLDPDTLKLSRQLCAGGDVALLAQSVPKGIWSAQQPIRRSQNYDRSGDWTRIGYSCIRRSPSNG